MCEKSVKIGHFSHVFHMVFHIHTPSSVTKFKLCYEQAENIATVFNYNDIYAFYQGCALAVPADLWP